MITTEKPAGAGPAIVGRPRLRALRLVGFKSFAERTVLELGPGISAVVGPNGSGKSNLADALRWALGEQGRALRARRSEDIIFAGSARRHATGMADVTLVIENEDRLLPVDYATLELGRRLYRSGENEYLLNRQRIRLRDLSDLLDGANLADNAFLFIGQGMVDQALSLRPEERRPLFEEVAGVRRHDRRRRQAESQLAEAEQNLGRVRDILGELRPQAKRLAVQARQVAAREEAGRELAEGLVRAAQSRWAMASSGARRTGDELKAARQTADAALAELTEAERSAAKLAEALATRASALQARRAERDAAYAQQTEARLAAQRTTLELDALAREDVRLDDERQRIDRRLEEARRAASRPLPATDPGAGLRLAALDRELAEADLEIARAAASRRENDERAASVERIHATQAAELELAKRSQAAVSEQARAAEQASSEAGAAWQAAAERAQQTVERLAAAVSEERVAEETLAAVEAELAAAESRRDLIAGRAAVAETTVEQARARLTTIEAIVAREEGPGIVTAARRRGGRHLAEGLEVDPALRAAVEAALGPTIRAAMVPEDVVLALRSEQGQLVVQGGAKPDDRERRSVQRLLDEVRAAGGGPLAEAVRRDPAGLVTDLLARTVWLPDLEGALAVRRLLPVGWVAVTPTGERVEATGVVSLGRAEALLEHRSERDAITAELGSLMEASSSAREAAGEAASAARRQEEARERARQRLEAARRERRDLEQRERADAGQAEAAHREAAWAAAQATRLEEEAGRATAALEAATTAAGVAPPRSGDGADEADGAAGVDDLAAWQDRAVALRARRAALAAEVEVGSAELRRAEDLRRRAEVSAELETERRAELERRVETVVGRRSDLEAARAGHAAQAARVEATLEDATRALAELEAAEAATRVELAAQEGRMAAARQRVREAEERARVAQAAQLEARVGLDQIRDGLLVELAGLGPVSLSVLRQGSPRASREDGPAGPSRPAIDGPPGPPVSDGAQGDEEATFAAELEAAVLAALDASADAMDPERPELAAAPSSGRLASLRRRYTELGAGNPFAAAEYEEVRLRLEALEGQEQDLDRAIDATRRLIAELTERIVEQFRETFAALEDAFARRFTSLFGGGDASLVLTEPDDLAATGVEIMARPPGKKRQALAMLSGGERALTAVALLFAMLEVRPVPFCVLDEVDAALDEANVGRFTEALRELAVNTQFIVITHNRGTIEAADTLYGVTIGDDAVSRVISLRLVEAMQAAETAG